ncbi:MULTISPECIES: DNA-binding protein [Sphingobacterium]|uniref:DNA-binding protein n=1 Tax=Sphingobacterium TaxID=28453 RepID=UPI0013D8E3CE|nr:MULTISPECIES: DNA-binding protein [unclassified Sphingobacterium]
MTVFKYIDRINLLDKLISQRRTGTPADLARRLGISVSRLYVIIDELKGKGAPVGYCRKLLSYYYAYDFSISITVQMQNLSLDDHRHISGGHNLFSIFLPTTVFIE